MPTCPKCGAENAEHMIACWRCARPVYPPEVADEIARRRQTGEEPKPLPPMQPTETTVAPGATEAKTQLVGTAQTETGVVTEELPTELLETAPHEGIAELPTESLEAKEAAPQKEEAIAVAPTKPVEAPPKAMGRKEPAATRTIVEKPKVKRALPFVAAGVLAAIIAVGAFLMLPRLLQTPQKVVSEMLSAIKAGDNERIKALLTKRDRERIEKEGGKMPFATLQNVEFEVGETTVQGSEATVKVKVKVTTPIKLEFEAPFICVREGLSWRVDGERTAKEIVSAAMSAAMKQWSSMLQEVLKKGMLPFPSPQPK